MFEILAKCCTNAALQAVLRQLPSLDQLLSAGAESAQFSSDDSLLCFGRFFGFFVEQSHFFASSASSTKFSLSFSSSHNFAFFEVQLGVK
jgi:hypothetical protein